jgi:hypothetical protein
VARLDLGLDLGRRSISAAAPPPAVAFVVPAAAPKRAVVPTMTTILRTLEFLMSWSIAGPAGHTLGCT